MISAPNQDLLAVEEPQCGISKNSFADENPLNILIAEDSLLNQKLAERILHKLGYKTDVVADGTQVLDSIKAKDYNVILMDVRMPEMDGLEATQIIRKMEIEQPYIIAMTANSMSEDKEECLNIGMNDYITKPMQLGEISKILKNAAFCFAER